MRLMHTYVQEISVYLSIYFHVLGQSSPYLLQTKDLVKVDTLPAM